MSDMERAIAVINDDSVDLLLLVIPNTQLDEAIKDNLLPLVKASGKYVIVLMNCNNQLNPDPSSILNRNVAMQIEAELKMSGISPLPVNVAEPACVLPCNFAWWWCSLAEKIEHGYTNHQNKLIFQERYQQIRNYFSRISGKSAFSLHVLRERSNLSELFRFINDSYWSRVVQMTRIQKVRSEAKSALEEMGISSGRFGIEYSEALERAVRSRDEELVKLLLKVVDIDYARIEDSMKGGDKDALWLFHFADLLDVNQCDDSGRSLLYKAIESQYGEEYVKALLEMPDIDVNLADKDGFTPLHVAARKGLESYARLLVASKEIDVNRKNSRGWSPLHVAVYERRQQVVRVLLAHPDIDVNCRENAGTPVLLFGMHCHCWEEVKLLLGAPGVDVNIEDPDGWKPVTLALFKEKYNFDIFRRIITVPGINLNIVRKDGSNWLDHVPPRHAEMIRLANAFNELADDIEKERREAQGQIM